MRSTVPQTRLVSVKIPAGNTTRTITDYCQLSLLDQEFERSSLGLTITFV